MGHGGGSANWTALQTATLSLGVAIPALGHELGLRACQPRAYERTTIPGEQPVASPDLIGRDFTATASGQRW
jgi:hypothetical protein